MKAQATAWKTRWLAFLIVVLDPWVIALLSVGVFLAYVLLKRPEPLIVAALTLVLSLISGVLGGLLISRWSALTEEKVIAARGKAAVRSLKLLLSNISALEQRVCGYLERQSDNEKSEHPLVPEVIKTYLEEVIGRCRVLEEEALSSIENWTDIVPEADIKTQIGLITDLRAEVATRTEGLEELRSQLDSARGQSSEREATLKKEIATKEDELAKVRRELRTRSSDISASGSGMLGSELFVLDPVNPLSIEPVTTLLINNLIKNRTCRDCGNKFSLDLDPGVITISPSCPRCGSRNVGYS